MKIGGKGGKEVERRKGKKGTKNKKLASTKKKIQMESLKTNATMYRGDNESLYHGCVVASHLKTIQSFGCIVLW
jgi:hypothetical protein